MGWWKYLTWERLIPKPPGRQFTRTYDIRRASDDQVMMMRAGKARSPEEATRILKGANMRAWQYIQENPQKKEPLLKRMKRRLIRELSKIEGSNRKIDHGLKRKSSRVPVTYERKR